MQNLPTELPAASGIQLINHHILKTQNKILREGCISGGGLLHNGVILLFAAIFKTP